jgi:hypothetical protein
MDEKKLSFGIALGLLKAGSKVQRTGWNGKGMYLELIPANGWTRLFGNTTDFKNLPWIGMKTADDMFVPWLASQTDILAEDWSTYE